MGFQSSVLGGLGSIAAMAKGIEKNKEEATINSAAKQDINDFINNKPSVISKLAEQNKLGLVTEKAMDNAIENPTNENLDKVEKALLVDAKKEYSKGYDMETFMMANTMARAQQDAKSEQRRIYIGGKR